MQALLLVLFATMLLLPLPLPAVSNDEELIEIQLRETPNELRKSILVLLPSPLKFNDRAEFTALAKPWNYRPEQLKRDIQLLARLNMETTTRTKNRFNASQRLIDLHEIIIDSDYDRSFQYMLKGRHAGRSQQDYQTAIDYYSKALKEIEGKTRPRDLLLLYTLHEHLGMIHLLIRQDSQALVHLNKLKSLAYGIGNDYFIAQAEATLGKYYYKNNQLGKALEHYGEAVRRSNTLNLPSQNAHLQLQLSRVYRDLKSWDEALTYAQDAADGFTALKNDNYLSACMTVMAMIYAEQGLWYQAIDYHLNAQQIDVRRGNYTAQALNFHNLGEAYSKMNDNKTSLAFLQKANAIFSKKKSKHYLVYNDLLIAEVAASDSHWELTLEYATLALDIAKSMSLIDEQLEALQLQSQAFSGLNQFESAFDALEVLIRLKSESDETAVEEIVNPTSALAEQKLKLALSQTQKKLDDNEDALRAGRMVLIISIFSTILLTVVAFNQWQIRKKLQLDYSRVSANQLLDPLTQHPGYLGFITQLSGPIATRPKSIALISLTEQLNSDLAQGYQYNAQMNNQQLNAISDAIDGQVYIIRPGLFMLSMKHTAEPTQLLTQIRDVLNQNYGDTTLHMGFLNLPLLADPAIKLEPELHFGVAQMMLSAAISLGDDKDYYVTMKALDFAPSAIFSAPLYLQIEKSIVRGIIRVDSNGNKENIIWPRWKIHKTVDLTTEKIAM